jgi:hypothetical protein
VTLQATVSSVLFWMSKGIFSKRTFPLREMTDYEQGLQHSALSAVKNLHWDKVHKYVWDYLFSFVPVILFWQITTAS